MSSIRAFNGHVPVLFFAADSLMGAFRYMQHVSDSSLWDNDFAVVIREVVKDKVQQLAGYRGFHLTADFEFG